MSTNRIFNIVTVFGDKTEFARMSGTEAISQPFDIIATAATEEKALPLKKLLGTTVTVQVELHDGSKRFFSGVAVEAKQVKRHGRNYMIDIRLRPAFWLLSLTTDFRIFQKISARDIIRQMLGEFNIPFKDKLNGHHPVLDYTVCYGENYFDFLTRLMEAAGISYYFEHANGSHTLVLCDSLSAYPILPSYAEIKYYPENMAAAPVNEEYISALHDHQKLGSGSAELRDYHYKGPGDYLDAQRKNPRAHERNQYEQYVYPGVYRNLADGDNEARLQLEALQNEHERVEGETNVRGLMPGYCTTVVNCPNGALNRAYRIISCTYDWINNSFESGRTATVAVHQTRFNLQPTSETFRPARTAPRPIAYATEVAIVTGPKGQEIWTNEHGCIKVWFPWDRHSGKDENSSCWVRVSQPWAGSRYGMMHVPRIGSTVVIGYVNNNPDFPIVISRVYDADFMPPWDLPASATQSGILTRSTKDGGYQHANAIRFEDKKGEEQLWMRAEKDHLLEVEHDEDQWIGNDRRKTIDRDETNHIKRDRTEVVGRDEDITVEGKRTELVHGNEDITIRSNRTELVKSASGWSSMPARM